MLRRALTATTIFGVLVTVGHAGAGAATCPPDAVRVGTTCVDKYEAGIWVVPPRNRNLVKKILDGNATLAELQAAGATQIGLYGPSGITESDAFPPDGQWTPAPGSNPPSPGVYAVSLQGAPPSLASWYQAQQACALAGKRLLDNEEWERAAAGTPDPGPSGTPTAQGCNHFFDWPPYPAGSRSQCVSAWGAYDMVGNFGEWVADWVFPSPDTYDPAADPAIHPIIDGIAGLRRPEPRYFAEDVSDGIGFRCGR